MDQSYAYPDTVTVSQGTATLVNQPDHMSGALSDAATELQSAIDEHADALSHLRKRMEPVVREKVEPTTVAGRLHSSAPASPLAVHFREQIDRLRDLTGLLKQYANDLDLN